MDLLKRLILLPDERQDHNDSSQSEEVVYERDTTKAEKLLADESLSRLLDGPSCRCSPFPCSYNWAKVQIWTARHAAYSQKSQQETMKFFYNTFYYMYNKTEDRFEFVIHGKKVCCQAFRLFWGLCNWTFYKVIEMVKQDFFPSQVHGNKNRHYEEVKSNKCRAWFQNYIETFCDYQPDTNEAHLPERTLKLDLYEEFVRSLNCDTQDIPSLSTFSKVWRNEFKFLKSPKETRLGNCDTCSKFREEISKARGTAQKAKVVAAHRKHINQTKEERKNLTQIHLKSQDNPERFTSILTDWCNPFRVPHCCTYPKGWLNTHRPKQHLFGLVNYGEGSKLFIPHLEFWDHSANLHLSFLFLYLRKLRFEDKLAPNLILQTDNCSRDNKNRWFLAFFAYLVKLGWFQTVEIHYLQPGHSHDMVDRECFGPLGQKFRSGRGQSNLSYIF